MNPLIGRLGHIGVLMGGCSSEREISLRSGKAIFDALKQSGCRVSAIDINSSQEDAIVSQLKGTGIDVAFIALHGQLGEDGVIQGILEKMNIPYSGSGVAASRLAISKVETQKRFRQNSIPIANFHVIRKDREPVKQEQLDAIVDFPVVVKPSSQGSSIGISLVEKKENLPAALNEAFRYDDEVLVEAYIKGRELTIGILDDNALPVIEIKPSHPFFDFTAKYQAGLTEYIIPAKLPDQIACLVREVALKAHRVLGCEDLSRVDVMLDNNNHLFVLEVNTIPGFTATSLLPKAAKANGIEFPELCLKIAAMAYRKQKSAQTAITKNS